MRRAVLIVSASMGAGHDRAAAELARRLEAGGHSFEIVNFLHLMPFGLGELLRRTYEFQLRRCSWTYELGYKILGFASSLLWHTNVILVSALTRRSIRRQLLVTEPDVVVSTYPFASLVLGHLRRSGQLGIPVATYLTDFAVHPLWVHGGVDLHLAVSPTSAQAARQRGAATSHGSGPLVDDRFRAARQSRDEVRRGLGIDPRERAVLVVAGSLGFGDVPHVVESIQRCGDYHVITVCGNNEKLRASLVRRGLGGTVLGWTDAMPDLMAAADALVENAGGLTAMEAFATGLPVITYRPIAGHGKDNARSMSYANVSCYAHDETELSGALAEITTPGPARDALVDAGRALFADDPAERIVELASTNDGDTVVLLPRRPHRRLAGASALVSGIPKGRRWAAIALILGVAVYAGLTEGAETVAAMGVGVAKPPESARDVAYVGVRLTSAELRNAQVLGLVERLHATAVVDGETALRSGSQLADLGTRGVDIGNGGWGRHAALPWTRARNDCRRTGQIIEQVAHAPAREFVPGRELDAFDQLYCRMGKYHARLVMPNVIFGPGQLPGHLRSERVYLLDGRHDDPRALGVALSDLRSRLDGAGLQSQSLGSLR